HVDLIPQVEQVTILNGGFPLSKLQSIQAPEEWRLVADNFVNDLQRTAALSLAVTDAHGTLSVVRNEALAAEAYTLTIDKGQIKIEAADIKGANHALTTLHQLVLTAHDGKLPVLAIQDKPVYGYRGLMLDCARHFWTVDELKETLDHMAFFKLNTLHLHLNDNQAWRMEMDQYPELTQKGTYYYDFPEMSGKYYSKADLKEIVRYAGVRGIEIIPEIDMPGHGTALLAALPELSCNGGTFEVYPEERGWNERKRTDENMICIGNPASFSFAEDVVDALVDIFPSRYIHFGGDEVSTHVWAKCPKCQALYKREGMKHLGEIQDYFTRKMSELIRSKGKIMIGWDEINDRGAATSEDVLTVWRDNGEKGRREALERGISVIMCPQHGCYYDWGYAGNSTRKVYEWNPAGEGITSEQQSLIKGGQAALWTERIATQDRVEWMLYPRICALAEVLWSEPSSRNWDDFYQRITAYYPVMTKLGINYYEDDAMNEKEFVPTEEKPALVRNAHIETNIPTNAPYHAEYAFDGKTNTFYWGGTSVGKEHYFKVILGEPMTVGEVKVISGDSKDYITMADLLISEDGENFVKVAEFDDLGQAEAKVDNKQVRAVMIQITGQHSCWPIVKEIILK
ncbi:MAG: family 20 glycosylhydrolase, partial [Phocaeicola sp.]|nr:family 20 glycosylhydrolase [Phocaeicola sp.]